MFVLCHKRGCRVSTLVVLFSVPCAVLTLWNYSTAMRLILMSPRTNPVAVNFTHDLSTVHENNSNRFTVYHENAIAINQSSWIQWNSSVPSYVSDGDYEDLYWPGAVWPDVVRKYKNSRVGLAPPTKNMTILYWTKSYSGQDLWFGGRGTPFMKEECPVYQCVYTADKSKLRESDAIYVHWGQLRRMLLPQTKVEGQKWILWHAQSPITNGLHMEKYIGKFDIKVGYESFMDVVGYWGGFVPISWKQDLPNSHNSGCEATDETCLNRKVVNYAEGKDKSTPVAWFVSNCHTQSLREKYTHKLAQYIKVDIYGACGSMSCTSKEGLCDEMLDKKYKFYLSFENSLCNDYITEEIWRRFNRNTNIVPIVLGGANYTKYFPPHSYIDIKDFASPAALAAYLHQLNHNDNLYNDFFHWRTKYMVRNIYKSQCAICELLHKSAGKDFTGQREDLTLLRPRSKLCITPEKYYGRMVHSLV